MKKLYLITLILIILFSSCNKLFDYNYENEKQVNVSCILHKDDTIRVNVSYTLGVNQSSIDTNIFIKDADVFIYEGGEFKEKLKYHSNSIFINGWYFSETFFPQANEKYKLVVVVAGYDTITAETFIPEPINIDTILSSNLNFTIDSNLDFEPPPDFPDMEPPPPDTSFSVDLGVNFSDKQNINNYFLFDMKYNRGGDFLSYDPVIETKNFENKYISITFSKQDYQKLIFSDTLFSGESYTFRLSVNFRFIDNNEITFEYQLSSLSKDAYLYYLTCYLQHKTVNNPLIEPVIIYSNINNGTGIFAGISSDMDSISINKN